MTPIPAPSPLARYTLPTPYFKPYVVTGTLTGTVVYSDITGYAGFVSSVLSATMALSQATAITDSGAIMVASAPIDYAPYLPRPMADVGYTIENMNVTEHYGLRQWAAFAGLMVSMPFQLLKILYLLVQFAGPLGLFITWLLVMVPVVLFFKLLKFVKDILIWLLNLATTVFEFLMNLFVLGIKFMIGKI
jgi:hypothetical protein